MRDAEENTIGLIVTQGSSTVCSSTGGVDTNYSVRSEITCNEDISEAGNPTINGVTYADCVYTVKMEHVAGCPSVNAEEYLGWLADNEWLIGIIYLVAGPIIALFGTLYFPYICASLIAIFVIGIVTSFCLSLGWMATTGGTVGVLIAALVLGVVSGMLVRRHIWIMVGLLGLVAGFFCGSLVYAFIFGLSGWDAVWGFWVVSVGTATLGCVAACMLGKSVVLLGTSSVGSYLFMRSWTLFFPGHWPSEAELLDGSSELEPDTEFWIFFSVFVVCFIGSAVFQCKADHSNDELDDFEKN